ncbi:MAG: hypothetical protein HY073_05295 [Deltaproteobacteria bacterium]|nr:hypothetical protein [Deltaproteobacteria bacterium]
MTVETATKIPNVTSPYTHSGLTLGQTYYYKMSASLKVTGTSQQPTLTEGDISDNEISSLPATPSPNFNRMPLPPIGGSGGGSGGVGGFPNFGGYGGGGSGGVGGTGGSGISCSVTSPLSGAFKVSMTPTITVVCSGLTAGRVSGSLTPSSGGTSIVLNELMCMSGDPSCPPPNAGYYKPQTSLSPATLYCTSFTGLTDPSGQAVIIPQSCFTTRQPILIQEMP